MTSIPFTSEGRDPYRVGHGHGGHGHGGHGHGGHAGTAHEGGPAAKRIVVGYGFWIFLLSDIVMFSGFFAAYAVLSKATAGGPAPADIVDLNNAAIETALLLASSFSCGMASIAVNARSKLWFYVSMAVTALFGLGFLGAGSHRIHPASSRPERDRRAAPFCLPSSPSSAATACTCRSAFSGC